MPKNHEVGERVYALRDSDKKQVFLYGVGTYVGDEIPSEEAVGLASMAREMRKPNPTIKLDDGQVVYGGECWWDKETNLEKFVNGRTVVTVKIADERQKQRSAEKAEETLNDRIQRTVQAAFEFWQSADEKASALDAECAHVGVKQRLMAEAKEEGIELLSREEIAGMLEVAKARAEDEDEDEEDEDDDMDAVAENEG